MPATVDVSKPLVFSRAADLHVCLPADAQLPASRYGQPMNGRHAIAQTRIAFDRYGDVVLALGLSGLALVDIWANHYLIGSKPVLSLLAVSTTAALAWRRKAPFAMTMAVVGALLLQVAIEPTPHPPDVPFLAWLITIYSLAAHMRLRLALSGGAVLIVAVGLWVSFSPNDGGTDLVFVSVILAGFWIAGRVVRSRSQLVAELAERTQELEDEREENARLAVAEERTRIARELHDVVAHSVSVMVVNAGAERLVLSPGQEATRDVLLSIEKAGREALGEMGRLVTMLRTAEDGNLLDPEPGLDRLDPLVERVRAAGLDVEVAFAGERRRLAPGADVSAYRIVQESLTNVIRHAHASRARIRLTYSQRELAIEVADDGVGPGSNGRRPGHGLVGIRERALLYGGELETGRSDLGGFLVNVRLPLHT